MIQRSLTRFLKIPKAINTIPNHVGPLVLMPLILAQIADYLKVSKYKYNCFSIVFSLFH